MQLHKHYLTFPNENALEEAVDFLDSIGIYPDRGEALGRDDISLSCRTLRLA